MITVVNKYGDKKLEDLTDLVKQTAEQSYYFDEYLINVFSEQNTERILTGEAAIFVDRKIMDLKFNEVPLMTLEEISDIVPPQRSRNVRGSIQSNNNYLNTLLRLGPSIMWNANIRAKGNMQGTLQDYQRAIYSLGDNISYKKMYLGFCQRMNISPKILNVPLLYLMLLANTFNYEYYLSKNQSIKKAITTFLLYHEIGHKRICPISDKIDLKLKNAASEVATPLDPLRGNYVNLFTDIVDNIANMLNGPQREEFKLGFNADYQFNISAPSITGGLPALSNLVFLDIIARIGQQKKEDIPNWVEQMFPKEYEIIKPAVMKIARSLAENAELAEKMYTQQASKEDVGIFYRRLRDPSKWEQKIKFYAKTINGIKEPSQVEREKMSPMPVPQIPLRWAVFAESMKRTNEGGAFEDEGGAFEVN